MAQFVCDPELTSGQLAQAARRDRVGDVYKWEPGGDAERYVGFVGPQHLVLVGTDIYRRSDNGNLVPHDDQLREPHIVLKPVGADPVFLTEHQFKTMYALIAGDDDDDLVTKDAYFQVQASLADAIARAEKLADELAAEKAKRATAAPDLADGHLSPAEQPSPPASPVPDESGRQVETGAGPAAPVNENVESVVPPTITADSTTAGDGEALTTPPSPATPKPKGKPGPKPKAQ